MLKLCFLVFSYTLKKWAAFDNKSIWYLRSVAILVEDELTLGRLAAKPGHFINPHSTFGHQEVNVDATTGQQNVSPVGWSEYIVTFFSEAKSMPHYYTYYYDSSLFILYFL